MQGVADTDTKKGSSFTRETRTDKNDNITTAVHMPSQETKMTAKSLETTTQTSASEQCLVKLLESIIISANMLRSHQVIR